MKKFETQEKINEALNFIAILLTKKKYLKAKVRYFDGGIKTNVLGNDMPKKICIILALLA